MNYIDHVTELEAQKQSLTKMRNGHVAEEALESDGGKEQANINNTATTGYPYQLILDACLASQI